ncbi:hypothetical protein [Paenibacillus tianmuensis]|uniref:hypothetical protein n=1 Tax=Paenibacillus tianmuensis TaxID=624147 RepID=UPI000B837C00|nr:hypothetical protein [Paenibacillus tianmuensis]
MYSSCGGPLVDQPGYKLLLGTGTVTATAQDQAGHTTVTSATYTVQVTYESPRLLINQNKEIEN